MLAPPPNGALGGGASHDEQQVDHRVDGLDGLRAVSMAIVLVYHHQASAIPGGFLGISLFFTLSGFLITSVLLRGHRGVGRIELRHFWARRYRRLLPAALLTLVGVVAFGATIATEQQVEALPGAVTAALAQVANWYFVLTDQSYVDLFSDPSPVQHFWSLAIEEQFYLLMPLVLVLLLRWTTSWRVVAGVLAAGAVGSTVAMGLLFEGGASLDRLYFGTDTRAAELLIGAVLAVVLHARPLPADGALRRALPVGGVVALVLLAAAWANVDLDDGALYRGGFLAVALLSAALILTVVAGRGPVAAALSFAPLAAFGRITYGVYLFHWPLYLWIDEDRTGLSGGRLLLLRLAVTVALAVASYHLLEMPIRQRTPAGPVRRVRWAIAPAVLLVLVGTLAVDRRVVVTDLAGLGEAATQPPVVVQGDGVLDVLVIADEDVEALAASLRAVDGAATAIEVATAAPFSCTGAVPGGPPHCPSWQDEWPDLIERFDPDVVLFQLTRWDTAEVAAASGATDLATQTDWVVAALHAGFDLLTSRGATVVWGQDPLEDMAEAVRRPSEPFYPAILEVTSERSDTRRRNLVGREAGPLVDDLELYQRRPEEAVRKVMVVGDSTARTVGYGLERWAAEGDVLFVWSGATEGCGIADAGSVRDHAGREVPVPAQCVSVEDGWTDAIAQFDPDVVLVLSHLFDLQDRRLDGWSEFLAPGDAAFDDYLLEEYVAATDRLSAGGAEVVWFTNPCVSYRLGDEGGDGGELSTERIRYVNDVVLGRLATARPEVRFYDLFEVLCPDGEFVQGMGGVEVLRTDGVHLSAEGSRWFAEAHGDEILDLVPPDR